MRICEECKNEHLKPRAKFCSDACNQRYRLRIRFNLKVRTCLHCGIEHNKKKSIKFCSEVCRKKVQYIKVNKKKRDNIRIKNGLSLDHPRLKKENGQGHSCTTRGYIVVSKKGHPNARNGKGSIYQHTLIMSEHLKRPLRKGESVHHKNGIRNDNRIENLELWSKSQPSGQRVEDKIKWAQEFLESYGYNVQR